ncbi:MAG: hypothetical protein JWQ76_4994, partial [Ramlibacter sp.]|nr:hypothetical protein [Ramlibacter sp.]
MRSRHLAAFIAGIAMLCASGLALAQELVVGS